MRLILLFTLFLVGCNSHYMQDSAVDVSLSPYLAQFVLEANKRGVVVDTSHLVVKFVPTLPKTLVTMTLGQCVRSINGGTVQISLEYWLSVGSDARELLMFHELGHCLLNLDHNDSVETLYDAFGPLTMPGMPSSIMSTLSMPVWLYRLNRNEYVNRLFGKSLPLRLYWNGPVQFNEDIYK